MRIKITASLRILCQPSDILDVEYDKDVLQGGSLVPRKGEYESPNPNSTSPNAWMRSTAGGHQVETCVALSRISTSNPD